jgi:hypothetical protein
MYKSILGPKLNVLLSSLSQCQPRTYIEIGCYQCVTLRLIKDLAPVYGIERCIGFDLFEQSKGEKDSLGVGEEHSPLDGPPVTYKEALDFGLEVYHGDTKETLHVIDELRLPEPVFAFIDGGHSTETCYSDMTTVRRYYPNAVLLIDDIDYPGVMAAIKESGYVVDFLPYFLAVTKDAITQTW